MPIAKVTNPAKITTDPEVLRALGRRGIDKDYVELIQDYGLKSEGKSPYAKVYRDLKTKKRILVVSGLPKVNAAGVKICGNRPNETRVGWQLSGSHYVGKPNMFSASVSPVGRIELEEVTPKVEQVVHGEPRIPPRPPSPRVHLASLTWQPQLFLDSVEQVRGPAVLLPVDPDNPNYHDNVLEWDYGICKRRLRVIEGIITEKWRFESDPHGEIRIKHNSVGDIPLSFGSAYDSKPSKVAVSVVNDEEIVPASILAAARFPVEVGASREFVVNASDGVVYNEDDTPSWADCRAAASGDDTIYEATNYVYCSNYWSAGFLKYGIFRVFQIYDTSLLGAGAVKSAAALCLYGMSDKQEPDGHPMSDMYIVEGTQGDPLGNDDYSKAGSVAGSDTPYSYDTFVDDAYNDKDLNATALGWISLTDNTLLALRLHGDFANSVPTDDNRLQFYSYEKGAGYYPKLVVTYTYPGAPTLTLRYTSALLAANPNYHLRNIIIHNNVMYLCEEVNNLVSSWSLANPILPVLLDTVAVTSPLDIKLSSDSTHIFVTGGLADSVYSIDISDPEALVLDDTLTDATWLETPHGCYVDGDFLYVGCYEGAMLTIVDVSDPTDLTLRGSLQQASLVGAHDVVVAYPYAYVTSHFGTGGGVNDGEVTCVNVSDPDAPSSEAISTQKSQYVHIVKQGNYLYVGGSDPEYNLYSFDVSTPTTLTFADKVKYGFGYWIALFDDYAIAADSVDNLQIVDISDPTDLIRVGPWSEAGIENLNTVFIEGSRYVYIACREIATGGKFKVLEIEGLPSDGGGPGSAAKLLAAGLI